MIVPGRSWVWFLLLAGLAGCGRKPAPPAGTGAGEAVRDFYEGVVRQDWQRAYVALHPDNKARLAQQEFTLLAESYRNTLGFNPEETRVQSCEEKGTEAIAHVVLIGHAAAQQRRYKDAVVLRRSAEGWRVLLPDSFSRAAR